MERNREWKESRHKIIKEKLYPFADIPGYQMKAKIDIFKVEYPDLLYDGEPEKSHISMYQIRKYIQQFF